MKKTHKKTQKTMLNKRNQSLKKWHKLGAGGLYL
jgi:hypothetical protein